MTGKYWYVLNLGDAMLAHDQLENVKQAFIAAGRSAGNLDDSAVFVRHESEGQLHCDVVVYFSPNADSLAKQLNALPCGVPATNSLSILVGSDSAWELFLPDSELE